MGKAIGIDLGTTNSCVAITEGRHSIVIPNKGGYRTTPSVVAMMDDGRIAVGQAAKRQAMTNPETTVASSKRLIGRRIESEEALIAKGTVAYQLIEGPHGDIRVTMRGREFSLPEVASYVLLEMKRVAEDYLQESVTDVVITVPAHFNDAQRQATKDAGRIANLNVLRIINEPTAAAIAYGFNRNSNQKIAVYDLGGGTFDISVLEISDGVFRVLATDGNTFLGGDDFDRRLMEHVLEGFREESGIDLHHNVASMQRVRDACERLKIDLSKYREMEVNLPFIDNGDDGPVHLKTSVTRKTLESLTQDLVENTLKVCANCLEQAGVEKEDLDDVVLVGGQTRMPILADRVSNYFGRSVSKQINPDEAVAVGASVQAHALAGQEVVEMLLLDVTPLPLGIKSAGGSFTRLIDSNTTVPVSEKKIFTTVKDDQDSVRIQVYQGESPIAEENDSLGEFVLEGVRPAPAGEPEVEVAFHIDANGILQVSGRDMETNQQQSIRVTMSSGLEEGEITQMRDRAKELEVALKALEKTEEVIQKLDVLNHKITRHVQEKSSLMGDDLHKEVDKLLKAYRAIKESKDMKKAQILMARQEKAVKDLEALA